MMKTFVVVLLLLSLLALGTCFVPNGKLSIISTRLKANFFEYEVGAQPPLGFFDPLGLVADGDVENFDRLRYVELKHGRICMLGVVGYLVTESGLRWDADIDETGMSFQLMPSGFDALYFLPWSVVLQMVLFVGVLGTSWVWYFIIGVKHFF